MAVLQTEDGRRFVDLATIDTLIAPTRIEAVPVPKGIDDLLALDHLDADQMATVLAARDPGLDADATGWPPPILQVFSPGVTAQQRAMLDSFAAPHVNPADEIHHVVAGAVLFGLVLADDRQVLLLVQPGEALHLHAGTEHWALLTADERLRAILHLSLPPDFEHRYTGTEIRVR